MSSGSRYREQAAPDYSHRFHAGNVGDVWKHCVLVCALDALAGNAPRRTAYLESHAGEGWYALGPTGEWTEGIGRLHGAGTTGEPVARYVALHDRLAVSSGRARGYPGSPAFAREVLGDEAELVLWERDDDAARSLAHYAAHPRTRILHGDGLAALAESLVDAEANADAVVALVDPPWTQKADWIAIPDALTEAVHKSQHATVLLWYPIKSLTRPNAMIARLRAAGVSGSIAELVTSPLEERRNRLGGSGMLLIRAPQRALPAICGAAPFIGARCAVRESAWSLRVQTWSAAG